MATDLQYLNLMSGEEAAICLQTVQLEQQYQEALRQAERIYEEERERALRIQLLLIEDENDELRDNIHENEDQVQNLENVNDELRDQLGIVEADFQALQVELKAQLRELDRYRAEVNALNATSSDSTKLFSEKLALSREVATLKPELEHLKSQAATQQNLLSEKLALEREMSALQVELENEKRTVQRIQSKDKTANHGESVMINEIENLKKELAKEKRNVQKQERELLKKSTDWDGLKENLEGKLEAFRNKLRATKEQLKEAQDEIERSQAAKFARSAEAMKARMNGGNSKKRNVAHFDPDMTIGTPGHGGPAKKQRTSVLPGDKSTFSITPFLNRTMSILPESPITEIPKDDDVQISEVDESVPRTTQPVNEKLKVTTQPAAKRAATKKATTGKKAGQPLKESTNPKANTIVKKPSLAQVLEEAEEESEQENGQVVTAAGHAVEDDVKSLNEPVKKKLFNKPTLFDDDEDVGPRRTKKLNLSGLRTGTGSGKVSLGGLGKNKVLAEFSPLKKDRMVIV